MTSSAPPARDEGAPGYVGWRVVLGCFIMAMCAWGWGFYGHSVYLAELTRLKGWSAGFVAGATTGYSVLGAALIAWVGDAVARLGPRRFVMVGAVGLSVSILLMARVETRFDLILAYGVMTIGWACLSGAAVSTLIGLWFDRKRGLALSLAMNGASAAGVAITPALVAAIHAFGFASAMFVSAVVVFAALTAVALLLMGDPPIDPADAAEAEAEAAMAASAAAAAGATAGAGATAVAGAAVGAPAPRQGRRALLRARAFWAVSAPFCIGLFVQAAVLVHLVAWLAPRLGTQGAAFAVTSATVAALLGRLSLGVVADRIDQRRLTAVSMASQAAAVAALLIIDDPFTTYCAVALYGFSVGNLITLPSLIVQREFPRRAYGRVVGLTTAVQQFAYAFGPGLVGVLYDATGGYVWPLGLCVGLELVAAALIIALRPRPHS